MQTSSFSTKDDLLADTPEVTSLLRAKLIKRSKRFQVFQQAETASGLQPNSLVRFNIPSSDCVDMRDAFVEFDIGLDGIIGSTSEVVIYNFFSEDNNPPPMVGPNTPQNNGLIFLRWFWEYKGMKTSEFDNSPANAVGIAAQIAAINSLQTIQTDGLDGFIQLTSNIYPGDPGPAVAFITMTNVSPNYKMSILPNSDRLKLILVYGALHTVPSVSLFAAEVTVLPGTTQTPYLEYGIGSVIDKVLIEVNSTVVYEIEGYNVLWNIFNDLKTVEYRRTIGRLLYNEGERETRNFTGTKRFAVNLYGIGLLDHIIPLDQIPGIQLRITVKLAAPSIALTTNTSGNTNNQSYHVDNARIYYHILQLPEDSREEFERVLSTSGLIIGYDQWFRFVDSVFGSTKDMILNFNVKRFLGVLGVMQEQVFVNNNSNFEKNANYIRNSIQSLRLKIGSDYYPRDREEALNNSDPLQYLIELLRFFGMFNPEVSPSSVDVDSILAGLNYEANAHNDYQFEPNGRIDLPGFIMAVATDSLAHEGYVMKHAHSSGVDTSGNVNITLEMRGLTIVTPPLVVNIFGKFTSFLILSKNEVIYDR